MATRSQSLGRVFCVTGVHSQGEVSQPQDNLSPINRKLSASGSLSSQSETDSNTSGYLSSSSMESSTEEKRLVLNEDKVYKLWNQWSMHRDVMPGPKSSTPKQDTVAIKGRSNITNQSPSLLAIKKNFIKSAKTKSVANIAQVSCTSDDSFWGIKTPFVQKSSSEGDIRTTNVGNSLKGKQVKSHDAGLDIQAANTKPVHSGWNHRTGTNMSTSRDDLKKSSAQTASAVYTSQPAAAPRFRSTEPEVAQDTHILASKLSRSCADLIGDLVDESMSEFLSNVDKDNLAGFLDFYDKVTSGAAYERARRNTKNYEPVYY